MNKEPVIRGGGASKPDYMDDDEWSEYKMTAEYTHEVSYMGDEEPPEEDDCP